MPKYLTATALSLSLGLGALAGCSSDHSGGSTPGPDQTGNGATNNGTPGGAADKGAGIINNTATTPGSGNSGGTK